MRVGDLHEVLKSGRRVLELLGQREADGLVSHDDLRARLSALVADTSEGGDHDQLWDAITELDSALEQLADAPVTAGG